jgi:hypothetical protein
MTRRLVHLVTPGIVLLLTHVALAQDGAKALFYNASGTAVPAVVPPRPVDQAGPPPDPASNAHAAKRPPAAKRTTAPATGQYMGVTYWVDVVGKDGQRRRVTTDSVFRSGDRIKLAVQTNRSGFLYVINLGTSGRTHVLFPHPGVASGSNAVHAGQTYEVPAVGAIRFDDTPGEELVLIMLSPTPIGDARPPDQRPGAVTADEAARLLMTAEQKGAKDLIVEADPRGPRPASYAVAPLSSLETGGIITVRLKLKHQS